jgi:hypothetical protein
VTLRPAALAFAASIAWSTIAATEQSSSSSVSRSPSMSDMRVASSAILASVERLWSMLRRACFWSGVTGPSASSLISSWSPRMTEIGVRSSCEAMLMNSLRSRVTSSRVLTYTRRWARMLPKVEAR